MKNNGSLVPDLFRYAHWRFLLSFVIVSGGIEFLASWICNRQQGDIVPFIVTGVCFIVQLLLVFFIILKGKCNKTSETQKNLGCIGLFNAVVLLFVSAKLVGRTVKTEFLVALVLAILLVSEIFFVELYFKRKKCFFKKKSISKLNNKVITICVIIGVLVSRLIEFELFLCLILPVSCLCYGLLYQGIILYRENKDEQ